MGTSPAPSTTPATTSPPQPQKPCSFNLTNLSDDLIWPDKDTCVIDPSLSYNTWYVTIFCDGYCLNTINIVMEDMSIKNDENGSCATHLYLESLEDEHPYNKTICFDKTSFSESITTHKLKMELRMKEDNPVSFSGYYYFTLSN